MDEVFERCAFAQCVVRPLLVVLDHPAVGDLPDLVEAGEQVQVEHLLAIAAIKALDVGVLVRLARLDILDQHAVGLGPAGEGLTEELRAVVPTEGS